MYEKVDTNISMNDLAAGILEEWKSKGIIEKAFTKKGDRKFVFLEGPPTANGRPHVGHLLQRTLKDAILRYKTMTGYTILGRSGGWDCHGLPVEIEAEKSLNINTKKEIVEYGIEKFNQLCRESVFRYIDEWKSCDTDIGLWVNHENDYITLRDDYIESEWWALSKFFREGMLYRDFKIVPYCPRCETSLSSHEVAQGYEEVSDPSVYVTFRVHGTENRFFLVWTTTPWTLPSNQFLAVSPDIMYVLVEYGDREYYVAEALYKQLFGEEPNVIGRLKGSELAGTRYEQLIPFLDPGKNTLRVVSGSFVSTEEGTGIVHIAPAFGADDFEVGKSEGTELLNPVNQSGRFDDDRLPWKGKGVKIADPEITKYLKEKGLLFRSTRIRHTYPFCYRCKTALLYYPLEAWFIGVSRIRKELMENNRKINWIPSYLKEGRFGNFLEEAKDWSLSRNRFWGTPIPVWSCPDGHFTAIESREELYRRSGRRAQNLHRPYVDEITFSCENCGKEMVREPHVIDTWFDSGSATYASKHYPMSGIDAMETLPVDFIVEGMDQTRGWYYSMHVISSLLFGTNAYNNVLTTEFVLDETGKKMSKSLGNSVYAADALSEMGADTLRLFFLSGAPWRTKNYDRKFMSELTRRNIYTLLNVYSFFSSNANLDGFSFSGMPELDNPLDRWIVSRLNSTIAEAREAFESYKPHECFAAIQDYIDDLSNSYLRLSRRRFWSEEGNPGDKLRAYSVLYHSLLTISKVVAPLIPFFAEFLYTRLNGPEESVHLESFPESDPGLTDQDLEEQFRAATLILERSRKLRQNLSIKGRQPVVEILVKSDVKLPDEILEIMLPELNTKSLKFIKQDERPVLSEVRLDFKKAAPVLKADVNEVASAISSMKAADIIENVRKGMPVDVMGKSIPPDFVEVLEKPLDTYGMEKDEKTGTEIFINRHLDRSLLLEGLSREMIRRVQVMRKEKDLDYDDHISLTVSVKGDFRDAVEEFRDRIMMETLSDELKFGVEGDSESWNIEGTEVRVSVQKLKKGPQSG